MNEDHRHVSVRYPDHKLKKIPSDWPFFNQIPKERPRLNVGLPSHHSSLNWTGVAGSRSHTIGLASRKGRNRSAERVEAHLSASSFSHLLSARWADNGRFDERRSPCRPIT